MENLVYISLGSNIQPEENLFKAIRFLRQEMEIVSVATTWETPAVGASGPNFLNTALAARCALDAQALKTGVLRPIEEKLGRMRTADKYAPRPIDLDIVIHHGELLEPRLWIYAYLALPMSELIPDYADPETGRTLLEIAQELRSHDRAIPHPDLFDTSPL